MTTTTLHKRIWDFKTERTFPGESISPVSSLPLLFTTNPLGHSNHL